MFRYRKGLRSLVEMKAQEHRAFSGELYGDGSVEFIDSFHCTVMDESDATAFH